VECLGNGGKKGAGFTGDNSSTNKPKKDKGCGSRGKDCLGNTNQLDGLIQQEIDRRFDPFIGWFPADFDYAASEYPTYDYYAEQAYEQAGYNLLQIAARNQDNPMTDDDWLNAGVPIEYIYNKGVGAKAPGHQFFLNYMDRDIKNPSNYEANYLNALMTTHDYELYKAKNLYYQQLLFENGSLQGAWEFLQMTIDIAGPDNPGG
jgi:hypothetical protein